MVRRVPVGSLPGCCIAARRGHCRSDGPERVGSLTRWIPTDRRRNRRAGAVRIAWGFGDFVWIYIAGLVASLVGASIGVGLTGDTPGNTSTLTIALGAGGQYAAWGAGLLYLSRRRGLGTLAADFGLAVRASKWWALLAGVGLQLLLGAFVLPLVHLVGNEKQSVVDDLRNASRRQAVRAARRRRTDRTGVRGTALPRPPPARPPPALLARGGDRSGPRSIFALGHLLDPSLGTVAVLPALFALGVISGIAAVRGR